VTVLRRWWRAWAYLWAALGLAVAGWVYVVLAILASVLMVFVVGFAVARAVLALGRGLGAMSLRLGALVRRRGAAERLEPVPAGAGDGFADTVLALVRAQSTWRAVGWAVLSAVLLPVIALAAALFPCAVWAARAHAALDRRVLVGGGVPAGRDESGHHPRRAGRGRSHRHRPRLAGAPVWAVGGGRGLIGMRERVEALGGRFAAGPTADGGFEVSAVLPVPPAAPAPDNGARDEADGEGEGRA
jgi:hypothetical protein